MSFPSEMPIIPLVNIPEYPEWDAIRPHFQHLPALELTQGWRSQPEANFAPGKVYLSGTKEVLLIHADLEDVDIFSEATASNQRLWQLGDVFEIFVKTPDCEDYCEFHISPNQNRLQLRYASKEAFREFCASGGTDMTPNLIPGEAFKFHIDIHPGRWQILAAIPWGTISPQAGILFPGTVLISCSRYDYTKGEKTPVLSSTSPHTELNFHRHDEWRSFTFQ